MNRLIENILCGFITLLLAVGCKHQSQQEKMISTTQKVLSAIQKDDKILFADLIGTNNADTEALNANLTKIKTYFDKYGPSGAPIITNKFTSLGKRLVIVPLLKGRDTIHHINEISIHLFFGPPQMVPLEKISGYSLIIIDSSGKRVQQFSPTTFDDEDLTTP
ncbi:hypothetical protein [Chitinophaga sp.]|uniref:hypothetical protein n=1 Tax=Chitinophaga sp. TaxID=1869181 RepID=UPI002F953E69